ncbi:MAG: TonB-dependent receptor [Bacteroidales bacterium]|nr:TonB-dependent receptor [Bacteroidales bacterium]MBO7324498.1 TonB-dependent receptor [Bacteroidales bacterium]
MRKMFNLRKSLIALAFCLIGGGAFSAYADIIKGQINGSDGAPVIGATVVLKSDRSIGTTSDMEGQFSINLDDPQNAVLVFSYLGFQTQEVSVGSKKALNVTLQESGIDLDDMVVIGYGTVKRRDLTGALSSISPKEITIAPTNNVMEALQGRISGLDITQSSGQIGAGTSVSLRGARSIYGNNSPLIVIDGVIQPTNTLVNELQVNTADHSVEITANDQLEQINPADIESIDILKDAASTAIYGSAGSNGVILITTKKGKDGATRVNFDSYYSAKGTPMFRHGMQGEEWLEYYKEAYRNKNGAELIDVATLFGGNQYYLDAYKNGQWIDWVDASLENSRNAGSQKYNLSISSGNAASQVYSSISYTRDNGLMPMESADKFVFRLNADQKIFDWAKAGFISNTSFNINNTANPVYENASQRLPLGQVYDEFGKINLFYIGTDAGNGQISPLADWRENQYANNQKSLYLNPTAYLELTPIKGLSFKTQASGAVSSVYRGRYFGSQCQTQSPHYAGYVTPYAEIYTQNQWSYGWDNILTFNKTFNKHHNLTATALTSWNFVSLTDNYTGSKGQELDSWLYYKIGAGSSFYTDGNYKQTQQMSYAGRVSYSYKGKYLASASLRYDGVSWLSQGRKWDYFPSVALAWRISDEGFMEDIDWMDNLKLRASYGITGNSGGMSAYATTSIFYKYPANISVDGPNSPLAGGIAQYSGTFGNGGIGWEKSNSINVGLDFGLFNGVLDGSIEYYDTRTNDLLYARQLPVTTGQTGWGWTLSSWVNSGKSMNQGLEVTLNSHNIRRQDFTWTTGLTFAWQKDKLVELPGGDFKDNERGWFFEGESINSVYGYKYVGIWQESEAEEAAKYGCEPGAVKIETVPTITTDAEGNEVSDNGVHAYGESDKQVLGTTTPKFMAGMNNSFTYKNWDLSVYMMGRFGHLVEYSFYSGTADITGNQPSGIDFYTADNTDAYYYAPGLNNNPGAEACNFLRGDFVKIKNITLGYTLPRELTKKAKIERARIYGTAYNPAVWTAAYQLNKVDPESSSSRYPLYRQYVIGLNLTF